MDPNEQAKRRAFERTIPSSEKQKFAAAREKSGTGILTTKAAWELHVDQRWRSEEGRDFKRRNFY